MDDWLAIATDSNGFRKAVTISDKEGAIRTAKYYRSIGYHARALPREEAEAYLDELEKKYEENMRQYNLVMNGL